MPLKQTVQDIIATREMGFARNINICRGILLAQELEKDKQISIINKPSKWYIDVNYVLFKKENIYCKVYLHQDILNMYIYDNNKHLIMSINENYIYKNDNIADIVNIINSHI